MPPFTSPDVRQPRAYLQIDGQNIPVSHATVVKSSTRSSDTFEATIFSDLSAIQSFDMLWWASQDAIDGISVLFSVYEGDTPKTMITGNADSISIDWDERTVEISGRDHSSKLSETRVTEKYNNQTISDVVSDIASKAGLNPVISGGSDVVGKQFDTDTTYLALGQTGFELLSDLAERYGYRFFVDGSDLHFEPNESNSGVYQVAYRPPAPGQPLAMNATRLKTSRNLKASKTVNVEVNSWDTKTQTNNQGSATVEGASGDALNYKIDNAPTLSQADADVIAAAKAEEVTRHELNVEVSMPGDLDASVTQKLSLSGTGTLYDQEYDIDHIHFEIGHHGHGGGGFQMTISTKAAKKGRKAS